MSARRAPAPRPAWVLLPHTGVRRVGAVGSVPHLFAGGASPENAAMRVLVLGAGFGGLELSTRLSETLGDDVEVTLIDRSDAFVFGFSKLDVMFGRTTAPAVQHPYRDIVKPGVRFV